MDAKKRWLGYGMISGITLLTVIGFCFEVIEGCLLFLGFLAPFYGYVSYRLTRHVIFPHIILFLPLLICILLLANTRTDATVIDFLLCLIFTCLPSLFFSAVTRHFVKRKNAPGSDQKKKDYLILGAQLILIMVWFFLANCSFLDDIVSNEILVGIILFLNLWVSLIQYGICSYRLTKRILIPNLILWASNWIFACIICFVEKPEAFSHFFAVVADILVAGWFSTAISLVSSALTRSAIKFMKHREANLNKTEDVSVS